MEGSILVVLRKKGSLKLRSGVQVEASIRSGRLDASSSDGGLDYSGPIRQHVLLHLGLFGLIRIRVSLLGHNATDTELTDQTSIWAVSSVSVAL